MYRKLFATLLIVVLVASFAAAPAGANPPAPEDVETPIAAQNLDTLPEGIYRGAKRFDWPNANDFLRLRERQRLLDAGLTAEAAALSTAGTDRVLIILVEFAGTDVFTWNPGDQWDPLGIADPNEAVYDEDGNVIVGDCSNIITESQTFTYSGPLHNELPRPLSAEDDSGDSIWTEDFSPEWFEAFMFGNGIVFDYLREDGSQVHEDFTGMSVKQYYTDLSGGTYDIEGDVIGWLQLPHSTWWYDADQCPGARSGGGDRGAIPGAGSARTLVTDALDAVNAISDTIEGFDWANYDGNGDGVIDRLWIVHAGYGEEDSTTLLNRTDYGEAAVWSHSSSVTPAYPVSDDIAAGPYIMMPENGGIAVFAHEYGHNLGAIDLYSYGTAETSAGFWTLMADSWTGYPIGYQPPSMDPYHLDMWGWLNPLVINDPAQEYVFSLGQASDFPGGENVYRGAKIELPDGVIELPVQPQGNWQWWGGKADLANAMMTSVNPIAIPGGGATLDFDLVYDIEDEWDFLWIQASADGGATWDTLTNENTQCIHDPSWIGGEYGFPEDLCGAGLGGFYGWNPAWPDYETQTFDLSGYAGQDILIRFWYMTDWGTTYTGAYIDNVAVMADGATLFSDDAESGDANWVYQDPWQRNDGMQSYSHAYYLQWRNTGADGGYDSTLGDPRWRFGPADTGMLVWYVNSYYTDNETQNYLFDDPSVGPKGAALVVDSHKAPYRDPALVEMGFNNEGGNVVHRSTMRDATFSLEQPNDFTLLPPYVTNPTDYAGRRSVPAFHDSMTYYPGSEFVSRGPAYAGEAAFKWVTQQWDASAVVPATAPYALRAPGYKANDEFRWECSAYTSGPYTGYLGCYWFGAGVGLGYDGGTGNPGDSAAQYGWHAEILSQTANTATVRVWNAMNDMRAMASVGRQIASVGDTIPVKFKVIENIGSAMNLFACAPVDPAMAEYVTRSATNGAMPFTSSCPNVAEALTAGQDINELSAATNGPVLSVGWFQQLGTQRGGEFGFQLRATGEGSFEPVVNVFDLWSGWSAQYVAPMVDIYP
jgi:immune inhibitor A